MTNTNPSSNEYPLTGNGKIALYVSSEEIGATQTLISGNVDIQQIGKYQNNTLSGFRANYITLPENAALMATTVPATASNILPNLVCTSQSLDMSTGTVITEFSETITSNLTLKSTVTPLRQYPYCILQEVEITSATTLSQLDIHHEIRAPTVTPLENIEYFNNVIFNNSISTEEGIYILGAKGTHASFTTEVNAATTYIFDDPTNIQGTGATVTKMGFNMAKDKSRCYQRLRFSNLQAATPIKMYVLSAHMSSQDFAKPSEEITRILLNILYQKTPQKIIEDNATIWSEVWNSDIELVPKTGITSEEAAATSRMQMYIRHSLFQIFSCLRSAVNATINPLNLSFVDTNGNIFFDGDLWLTPALLLLQPEVARQLLEFRYRNLEIATQLASSHGYNGSMYPYKNDVVGYESIYWDVVSPLHIFNNATLAINAWNYYRISLNKEWLRNKGYTMIKNIADFLTSYIKKISDTEYILPLTLGMGSIVSDNQAFTVYTALHAIQYAREASFALGYSPNSQWLDILSFLKYPVDTVDRDILLYDKDNTQAIDIHDHLFVLHPYYNRKFFQQYTRNYSCIDRNLQQYQSTFASSTHPLNTILDAALKGVLLQSDASTHETPFVTALQKVIDTNFLGGWNYMNTQNNITMGTDISLHAAFLLIFLMSIGTLSIRGAIAPSAIVTEQFRIATSLSQYMPHTWSSLRLKGIGSNRALVIVTNQTSYTAP
jgi:trehalose/maltose hydrolase-like predicted phosphorylase